MNFTSHTNLSHTLTDQQSNKSPETARACKESDADETSVNFNQNIRHYQHNRIKKKKKKPLQINFSIFITLFIFIQVPFLVSLLLDLRCLSGSNGNLPHSDEVVSVASEQSLRKNKYETLCLIQVLKSSPSCCIYTLYRTAHWLKRQKGVSHTGSNTKPNKPSYLSISRPGQRSALWRLSLAAGADHLLPQLINDDFAL